jgi:hypothetical protein
MSGRGGLSHLFVLVWLSGVAPDRVAENTNRTVEMARVLCGRSPIVESSALTQLRKDILFNNLQVVP